MNIFKIIYVVFSFYNWNYFYYDEIDFKHHDVSCVCTKHASI